MLALEVALNRGRFTLEARLEFDEGVTGLFGPSGSGKSTLLGLIAGLVRPDRGRIVLDGEPLYDDAASLCLSPHRRRVGLVFQDAQLFPHFSVRGNLLYGLRQIPARERRFHFRDIVDLLALEPLLNAHPRRISGGEKQRVALGRSLLASPRLLLLDEPLASLDARLKAHILPFLEKVRDELDLPILFVSHALPEILYLTDRLALMEQGRIVASGGLEEILRTEPGSGRFGLDNVLTAQVEFHDVEGGCTLARFRGLPVVLPLRTTQAIGRTTYVSVHKGEIALSRGAMPALSIQNQWPGRIVEIEARGSGVEVHLDIGAPLVAEISPRACRELGLHVGETVYALIKTRSFVYLAEQAAEQGLSR